MKTPLLILTTLAATLTACVYTPERNAALDQARSRYATAQATPQVTALAPEELNVAGTSLRVAEQAMTDGSPSSTVDHLAYMANQRVVIAQETASSRASQAVIESAAAERERMRLATRSAQVDSAERRLAQSQMREQRSDARVDELESQLRDLRAVNTDRGIVVTLGDMLFYTGQSRLLRSSNDDIAKLADFFRRNPGRTASIEGHTDNVGSANANYALSEQRAIAVKQALMARGVASDRLSMQAFGQDSPTASNDSASGRQLNRRVEIIISPHSGAMSSR